MVGLWRRDVQMPLVGQTGLVLVMVMVQELGLGQELVCSMELIVVPRGWFLLGDSHLEDLGIRDLVQTVMVGSFHFVHGQLLFEDDCS